MWVVGSCGRGRRFRWDPFRLETHVVATIFGLVGGMKRSHAWEEVEVQVERLHLILVGLNVLWK